MSNIKWDLELILKPDFEASIKRIYAWYEAEIIDRPPVRFTGHNAEYQSVDNEKYRWQNLKEKWFDAEYQVDSFIESAKKTSYLGETFPVYMPNLGPNVYASFYGSPLEFGDVTSWVEPIVNNDDDIDNLKLDIENEYFRKIKELTACALSKCQGQFMVGYTDLHPGMDCVDAWRGTENLCFDMFDSKEKVKKLCDLAINDFQYVYDYFDNVLKNNNQLSCTWMGIPSFGKMHIPSCDFSSMISTEHFIEFCLPILLKEIEGMTHNIFHLDGKDVARHLDIILQVKDITAIQWVQGVGVDRPIMQWIPLIKEIQSKGKGIVVDLKLEELENFAEAVSPEGIFLCIDSSDKDEQTSVLKFLEKWR